MARMRWHFPKTDGGMDYVQDPSSTHFNEAPIPNLVREVIQNSLDAKYEGVDEPVTVTFTETYIKSIEYAEFALYTVGATECAPVRCLLRR